jgi:hypothetical protein
MQANVCYAELSEIPSAQPICSERSDNNEDFWHQPHANEADLLLARTAIEESEQGAKVFRLCTT